MVYRGKNSSGLHTALTSASLNPLGGEWNTDCTLVFLAQHQCLTSLIFMGLNKKQGNPHKHTPRSCGMYYVDVIIAAMKKNVQKEHDGQVSQIFGQVESIEISIL